MEKEFGDVEWISCWRMEWNPTPAELLEVVDSLIEYVGMTPEGDPDIREYPNLEGKGGYGCQIYRVLTESYVVAGTWPDIGITRILLASCKPYSAKAAGTFLRKRTECGIVKAGFYHY
jgi:hypothetical protein